MADIKKVQIEEAVYDVVDGLERLNKVYLKENIVQGVNILTQDMFYKDYNGDRVPNTDSVFVIKYDFDLDSETITIPSGSVLRFIGGSISNGSLVLNDTIIESDHQLDCTLSGHIYAGRICTSVFKSDNNDGTIFQNCFAVADVVEVEGREFSISSPISLSSEKYIYGHDGNSITSSGTTISSASSLYIKNLNINTATTAIDIIISSGNRELFIDDCIISSPPQSSQIHTIHCVSVKTVTIKNTKITGGYCSILASGGNYTYVDNSNIVIEKCDISDYRVSGIQFSYYSEGTISQNVIHDFKGNGIALTHSKYINVVNNIIYNYYVPSDSGSGYAIGFSLGVIYSKASNNIIYSEQYCHGICSDLYIDNNGTKTEIGCNEISFNTIKGVNGGIILNGSDNSIVRYNKLENVTISAIRAQDSNFSEISNNSIRIDTKLQTGIQIGNVDSIIVNGNDMITSSESGLEYFISLTNVENAIIGANKLLHKGSVQQTAFYCVTLIDVESTIIKDNIFRVNRRLNGAIMSLSTSSVSSIGNVYQGGGFQYLYRGSSGILTSTGNVISTTTDYDSIMYTSGTLQVILDDIINKNYYQSNPRLSYLTDGLSSNTKRTNKGSTTQRPDSYLEPYWDNGSLYYDTTLNKLLVSSYYVGDSVGDYSLTANQPMYISNALTAGRAYKISKSSSNGYTMNVWFCKTQDNSTNAVRVVYSSSNSYIFTAREGYSYICIQSSGSINVSINSLLLSWKETDNSSAGVQRNGTFANKPTVSDDNIPVGFRYFCTDKQTSEGATDGIEIIHKGSDVWVDALGRVIS